MWEFGTHWLQGLMRAKIGQRAWRGGKRQHGGRSRWLKPSAAVRRIELARVEMKELLESGVHFGHQTRRWNPKMKRYIFMERNGIHILDLNKTITLIDHACKAISTIASAGRPVLFVGTKKQVRETIMEEAVRCSSYYVANRWLGGMLTNFQTIRQSIKRLDDLDTKAGDGTFQKLTKNEVLGIEQERTKLDSVLSGIRHMGRLPGALVVVDTKKEGIAVAEANILGIPVFAVLDTNCDPDLITYPIPGNDDAIRSVGLILHALSESVIEGMQNIQQPEQVETAAPSRDSGDRDPRRGRRRPPRGPRSGSDTAA
jgi:small subunit ribosomal protein S2